MFGRKDPVVLAATICFEQNYSGVDGDSATLAEMVLILSTLANLPIDQSIAVTGSVNQFGEVQPVGGINEKVEGFFRVCKIKGFNGRQGVIIPVQNMKHLMLQREVREAVERGEFHIWTVTRVEEAFELLTGYVAGEWDESKQRFTPGSAFAEVAKALHPKSQREQERTDSRKASKRKSEAVKSSAAKKKPVSKKAPARKAPAKKPVKSKAPAKKSPARKSPTRKSSGRK